ncbi:hypothetical protein [Alcanivorax sp. 1008]|uniref:hypothetical protein n=1 Tax=Alcanivorax sp. 1008 TaxID=2816853 RepID=UPI001D6C0AAE|nr:hypothetical protein [Alcanivorax sp. 1008]MCC1496747.1 hypothetical protein [Alcanivorax sp. 1008]
MKKAQIDILTGGNAALIPSVEAIAAMPPVPGEQVIPVAEADAHLRLAGVKKTPEDKIVDTMADLGWSGPQMEALLKLRFPESFRANLGDEIGDIGSLSE